LQDDVREAHQLIKDMEPAVPQEYILKGVVNAAMGQENGSVCPQTQLFVYLLA
jgi:intraflagellar transport protein 56